MSIPRQYQGLQSAALPADVERHALGLQFATKCSQPSRRPKHGHLNATMSSYRMWNTPTERSHGWRRRLRLKLLAFVGKHRLLVERITIPPGFSTRPTSFITCETGHFGITHQQHPEGTKTQGNELYPLVN